MGIAPITNLDPLPLSGCVGPDLEPVPMARIENSARTGDETYSPSGGDSARESEDGGCEDEFENHADESATESAAPAVANNQSQAISFFA